MIFPTQAPIGTFVPLEGSLSRALDVLYGLPLLLPPEMLIAANMLHQFARSTFGPEAPETQGIQTLHQTLTEGAGDLRGFNLQPLFEQWQAHEGPSEDPPDPITVVHPVAPLFNAGGVRFFQSPDAPTPLRRGEIPTDGTVGGGYLVSNERNFHRYFDRVRDVGGVTVGLGSLQNVDLAVAAGASGLVLADISPTVSMTLALLLPRLGDCRTPQDFRDAGESLIRPGYPTAEFLDPIPEDYRPAFERHLTALRTSRAHTRSLRRHFMSSLLNPHSFLGSQESFERAANLAVRGGISLIYGNFFGEYMPELLALALETHEDPIRVINTTNAPEQIVARNYPVSAGPLLSVLEGEIADPKGHFLTSTEFGHNQRQLPAPGDELSRDPFRYNDIPIRAAAILLRTYGHLAPFVRRFERSQGI
jgi:hypothetical protein